MSAIQLTNKEIGMSAQLIDDVMPIGRVTMLAGLREYAVYEVHDWFREPDDGYTGNGDTAAPPMVLWQGIASSSLHALDRYSLALDSSVETYTDHVEDAGRTHHPVEALYELGGHLCAIFGNVELVAIAVPS